MARLEDLAAGATVRGLTPDGLATVMSVNWYGDQAIEVIYKDSGGKLGSSSDETRLTRGRAASQTTCSE